MSRDDWSVVIGLVLVVGGAALAYWPAGVILGGVWLIAAGILRVWTNDRRTN